MPSRPIARIILIALWICAAPAVSGSADGPLPREVTRTVSVHPDATVVDWARNDMGGGRRQYEVNLKSTAPYPEIVAYYRKEAARRGWRVFDDSNREYGYFMVAHDGTYKIDVMVSPEGGANTITFNLLK